MAEKLTPQQAQAITDRGGKLLVSAAAGSGKTKVLVDRLLSYLTDPVDPANLDEFLIITYTKAAASELRGKIASKLTERIAQEPENKHLQKQMQRLFLTQISTVHGFCSTILREYAYRIDLSPDFRVADENECKEIRETVLKDLLDRAYTAQKEDPAFREFVDTQGVGRNDSIVPEIIQKVYDNARCHLDAQGWLDKCLRSLTPDEITDVSETVWGKYLVDDLFSYLDRQISVMGYCLEQLQAVEGMDKAAANLESTVAQLEQLRACTGWDAIHNHAQIDYGRLVLKGKNLDPELADQIKAIRDACKEGLPKKLKCFANDSAQILHDLAQSSAAASGLIGLVRQFEAEYTRAKRGRRVLDFSDLEHSTLDLLLGKKRTGPTAAAAEIGKRFREIMVDEYQDSNGVQDAIFDALTREKQNCFMVGDVKQSIYQFRLADPTIFLDKYIAYQPAGNAARGQGRKILLSHNFRSGGEVISGINDVFFDCMSPDVGGLVYGEDEALREGVPHIPLPDPAVELYALEIDEESYPEEAAFTASRIRRMLTEGTLIREGDHLRPVRPEDIVILLRSPGPTAWYFQKALEAAGIRCAIDGGMDLMKTEEVSTFCAFLQTIANPRQDIPLLTVLASPIFGFTADELAKIRAGSKKLRIYDSLRRSDSPRAQQFLPVLETLREKARTEPLTSLLESCLNLTRMDSVYGACPGGKARIENLQMFYRLAADYEKPGLRSLDQFLEHLESMQSGSLQSTGSSTAGCVTIMSIHKSKGLEFPVVFLCALSRKFNQESLREQVLCHKDLGMGLSVTENDHRIRYSSIAKRAIAASIRAESLSEEMRVLYVAMTRAKDRLVMTCALGNAQKKLSGIARRLSADGGDLLCRDASSPGDWILTSAIRRMEAGALHSAGGRPEELRISEHPWKIDLVTTQKPVSQSSALEETTAAFPEEALNTLKEALSFRYAHEAATRAPSKQTATGRKGRIRDEETLENTRTEKWDSHSWRKPAFRSANKAGRERGTAQHSAMQFIRYENCTGIAETEAEIARLTQQGFLTEEQAAMVDAKGIAAFFDTEIGRKLRNGAQCLREFKFSILDDGTHYGDGLEGESVLLQGVVDCALLEPDGITIVDFKTDSITEETLPQAVERYRPQLETYSEALSRIYESPVKARYLYFFCGNRFALL